MGDIHIRFEISEISFAGGIYVNNALALVKGTLKSERRNGNFSMLIDRNLESIFC